jgi:hypothetical protein
MAPNVAKVDADRQLYLGTLAGYFRDEVVRWLLHGNSLLLLQRTCSSHLPGLGKEFLVQSLPIRRLPVTDLPDERIGDWEPSQSQGLQILHTADQ